MTASLIAQLALATFVAVQFTKFLLDSIVPQSNPYQQNITRLYVYGVAIAVCALALPLHYTGASAATDAKTLLVAAFQVFAAAVGTYHLATGLDAPAMLHGISTLLPFTPDPAPAAPAAEPAPEQAAA